jgi:GNAT superfamily N-acetyltransferase
MNYRFTLENGAENRDELEPLYRQHYAEMAARLAKEGIDVAPFSPRWDMYEKAWRGGYLLNFVVRADGEVVGYSNIYLTSDMHNGEMIAREDTIYVLPEHRNGVGKKLSKAILGNLRSRGVKRLHVQALTDLRVAKLWKRMGFKHTAHAMTYTF